MERIQFVVRALAKCWTLRNFILPVFPLPFQSTTDFSMHQIIRATAWTLYAQSLDHVSIAPLVNMPIRYEHKIPKATMKSIVLSLIQIRTGWTRALSTGRQMPHWLLFVSTRAVFWRWLTTLSTNASCCPFLRRARTAPVSCAATLDALNSLNWLWCTRSGPGNTIASPEVWAHWIRRGMIMCDYNMVQIYCHVTGILVTWQ